jgi:light-regulated signal transduction histidine kinase (bacteriophytochrome)
MHLRLSDDRIRSTCRDLLKRGGGVSGRALRRELRARFGSVGKTARVFEIWREEVGTRALPINRQAAAGGGELEDRLAAAEAAAAENLARAERAEYREMAHQDRWGMEVDRLREQLRAAPKYAQEIRHLQEQVLRLSAELQAARTLAAE